MEQKVRLSSPEIAGLWGTYIQETMSVCLLKYFQHHAQDQEIKSILEKAFNDSQTHINQINTIFKEEKFPIPDGFTDSDVDLTAPPLFYDTFALSFIYSMSRLGMINYAFILSNTARADVLGIFKGALNQSSELYKEATTLMLEKGIYDRPPMINYPEKVEYIQKETYLTNLIGKKRTLNVTELTEIFFNIERNYFGLILSLGLIQVVDDKEIKDFLKQGKNICEKQIKIFNELLIEEDLLGTVPVSMEVTNSTRSPFSNRLILSLFHLLNSLGITLSGHALSLSMRADLAALYSKHIADILIYAEKGFGIMVDHRWLEQPPQAPNRKELEKM